MRKRLVYSKFFIAAALVLAVDLTYGAFTGNSDNNKDKFSLKHLNSSQKVFSLSFLNTNTFHYKGSVDLNQQQNGMNNQLQFQSIIRLENGNTTYVYPYKYTVKVPKFVTPTAPRVH